MKTYQKISLILLVIIISFVICSCATKHSVRDNLIYKDDTFTPEYLQNKTLIVGGISSSRINLTNDERMSYSSLLTNIFIKKKEENTDYINTIGTYNFRHRIGKDKFVEIMKRFDQEKILDKETMHFLCDTIPYAAFILLVYIENEDIVGESFNEYIEDEDGDKKLQITYKKTYSMSVESQIYDILLEKMVWNISINNVAKRTVRKTKQSVDLVFHVVEEIFEDEREPPDHAKINREEVLEKVFEKFAEDLAESVRSS